MVRAKAVARPLETAQPAKVVGSLRSLHACQQRCEMGPLEAAAGFGFPADVSEMRPLEVLQMAIVIVIGLLDLEQSGPHASKLQQKLPRPSYCVLSAPFHPASRHFHAAE